jgi:iron complex outermembrane recepter protein
VIYESDTTLNYEVGLRSNWLDGNLVLNAALYHIDWEEAQLEAVSIDGFFITRNVGDAETQGLELDLRGSFGDYWWASLNYAYNTAELTSYAPRLIDSVADGFPGDRLAGVPEHQVGAHLNFSSTRPRGWQFDLDYSFTYSSDFYTKVGLRNNGEVLPSFTFHNIAGTFRSPGNWTIRLFVDNLFDEFTETNVRGDPSFIRDVGVHPLRWNYRNVARPRRYGVEIRYDFGFD